MPPSASQQVEIYKFVPIQNPAALRHQSTQRVVRSHAARTFRRAIQVRDRQLQRNFRVTTMQDMEKRSFQDDATMPKKEPLLPSAQPNNHLIDPFMTLPRSASRLQVLLNNHFARQAGEPVITFGNPTPFGDSTDLYKSCLTDSAFLNALMLSLAFMENSSKMSLECWTYRGEAIRNIASRLEPDEMAIDEMIVGAILILTGIEYQAGNPASHGTHMSGLARILKLQNTRGKRLCSSTIRSIFWQDLNGAVISGCARLFDHTTFPELFWSRAQQNKYEAALPPGLDKLRTMFSADAISVFEDINSFRMLRDSQNCNHFDFDQLIYIDNAQAWNESRLFNIQTQSGSLSFLVDCSLTGAYICSYSLFSEIWAGTFLTSRLSTLLLRKLNKAIPAAMTNHQKDLLLWLVYIGAAFSKDQENRHEYIRLLRLLTSMTNISNTWEENLAILRLFIWSDNVFYTRCFLVWTESQALDNLTANGD